MIARIWIGVTPAAKADAYLDYLQNTGLAEYATVPGHRATFTIVTHWESMEAIKAFSGDTPEIAKYYPEDDDYLLERRPTVEHHHVIWTQGSIDVGS